MAIVVILVLAILWAAVLVPPVLRARNDGGGGRSSFVTGMNELISSISAAFGHHRVTDPDLPELQPLVGPVGPVGAPAATLRGTSGMTAAQRRRRNILIGLLAAAGITLVMAIFSGGTVVFLALQGITDVLLGAYIYLLLQLKTRQTTRRAPIRAPEAVRPQLRPVPDYAGSYGDLTPVPEPALALRRTASF